MWKVHSGTWAIWARLYHGSGVWLKKTLPREHCVPDCTKLDNFLELNFSKYTWSTALCKTLQKVVKSLHPIMHAACRIHCLLLAGGECVVNVWVGWLRKFSFSCFRENFAKFSVTCFAKFSFSFAKFSRNTKLKFLRNFREIRRKFRETPNRKLL